MTEARRRRQGEFALRALRWALLLGATGLLAVMGHAGWRMAAAAL